MRKISTALILAAVLYLLVPELGGYLQAAAITIFAIGVGGFLTWFAITSASWINAIAEVAKQHELSRQNELA